MKILIASIILALVIYYSMGNLSKVADKAGEDRKVEMQEKFDSILTSTETAEVIPVKEIQAPIKAEKLIPVVVPEPPKTKVYRPPFRVTHSARPQDCNLAYKEGGELIKPLDMKIHDYLKWSDGDYYFAVTVGAERFLLSATDIQKEECTKEDLDLAYKFAAYCKAQDQTATTPKQPATSTQESEKEVDALSDVEIAHIKGDITEVTLTGDHFRQSGKTLNIYKDYKRPARSETYEQLTGSYYLMEGKVPETYRYSTGNGGYSTKTVTSATVWTTRSGPNGSKAYCTSYELAYYHAVCAYFENVKRKFYKGPKPTAPSGRNYR
jgi:hypothetical protein